MMLLEAANTLGKSRTNGYAQLITMLIIFVVVLAVTAFVTKWIANYQKSQNSGRNIEVIETTRLANNKWIQIVRVGKTMKVIAISKDNVTYLGDVDSSEINQLSTNSSSKSTFKSMFDKAKFSNTAFSISTKNSDTKAAFGHSYGEATYALNDDKTKVIAVRVCSVDQAHIETETATVVATVSRVATCELSELTTYSAVFANEAFSYSNTIETAKALGHSFGEVVYTWNSDHSKCSAKRICLNDNTHYEQEECESVGTVSQVAACESPELTKYSVTFENTIFGYVEESVETKEALGHSFGEYVSNNDATTKSDGTKTRKCVLCNKKETVTDEGSKKSKAVEAKGEAKDLGIKFESKNGFVSGTVVTASVVTETDTDFEIKKNEKIAKIIDIDLSVNGSPVTKLSNKITLVIKLPTELEGKSFRIAHAHDDEILNITLGDEAGIGTYIIDNEGNIITQIDRLSEFALIEIPSGKSLSTGAIVAIVISSVVFLLIALYVLGYFFLYRNGLLNSAVIEIMYSWIDKIF